MDGGPEIGLSVVVPAYDEAPNLARLAAEVAAALDPTGLPWELIVVDDGSDDETPALLARLAAADPRLRPLRLAERSGQTAALAAGFRAARGTLVATLDADLQCPPSALPGLLEILGDADLASGIRATRRGDPLSRRLPSALSNLARRLLIAPRVRDLACPIRVLRRDALPRVEAVTPLFPGAHRWLPALFWLAGLRVVQRPVPHQARTAGVSKYTTRGRLAPVLRELAHVVGLTLACSRARRVAVGALLLGVAAAPFFFALGRWPLMEPDEGRNAEVAREMLAYGSWSVPRFNGLPYLDKPVLLFWMGAAAFRALGVTELAARLPSAVSALATVGFTYGIARPLVGVRRALLAAGILATMPLVLAFARLVIFDMPLTALVTAALFCLLRARLDGRAAWWLPVAGLVMGLATLMKGPVGFAVPLLAWVAGRGALGVPPPRGARSAALAGLALGAGVVIAWIACVLRQEPAFLHYAVLDETLLRFTSVQRFHRGAPVYYYATVVPWALGGWSLVLAVGTPALVRRWRAGGPDARAIAFSARATLAVLLFFTCSASKRCQYILPAMVPLAILTAIGAAAARERVAVVLGQAGRWVAVGGAVAVVAGLVGFGHASGEFRLLTPAAVTSGGAFLVAWGAVLVAGARRPAFALLACAAFAPGLGLALLRPLDAYAEGRSSRALAARIGPDATVVCVEAFRTGLPFYLGHPVLLLSANGRELTSNYVEAQAARLMDGEGLAPLHHLSDAVGDGTAVYLLASPWRLHRLMKMTPRRLETVYADRHNVLLRPAG